MPSSSDGVFLICESRRQRVRLLSFTTSLAKRSWARSLLFCTTWSRPRMHGPVKVYASCCRTSCTSVPLMSFDHCRRVDRESTTDTQREGHESEIINMVRTSLVDDDATVRTAAAKAFDTLQEHIGAKAIDQTIPTPLEALRQPGESSGTALQALREVMSVSRSSLGGVYVSDTYMRCARSVRRRCSPC